MKDPRPAVAVVLPFHGDAAEAEFALRQLNGLATQPGDELVLADNTVDHIAGSVDAGKATALACTVKRAVYAARNEGAERTSAPWLLFVDADCVLPPDLLDRYFDPAPTPADGAVAGAVEGISGQPKLVSRYVRARGHLDQEMLADHGFGPTAVTANLLVRRQAFDAIGGFQEQTRSGGDLDFSWRIQRAGFELGLNTAARVGHDHRETLRPLLKQARRIGAGSRWLGRRHPGYDATFSPAYMARAVAGTVAWPILGQPERGAFKALDGIWGLACDFGMLESNIPAGTPNGPANTTVVLPEFPVAGNPLTAACVRAAAGGSFRVEAAARPERPAWSDIRGRVDVRFWEDEAPFDKTRAATRLLAKGHRVSPALAPVAARLAAAGGGARVLAHPSVLAAVTDLVRALGRTDMVVEALPEDPAAAARSIDG